VSIEITDLSTLDPDLVEQLQEELAERLQEAHPTLDLKSGVLRDLLLNLSAILEAKNQTETDRIRRSASLAEIEADPSLADDDAVDNVMSNYRITRQEGEAATGQVTIIVSTNTTTTIAAGAIFEADGKQFTADTVFVAKAEPENVQATTDRLMQALSDGSFAFVISVTASEVGAESMLKKDTLLTPETPPLNFVKALATNDFTGGVDTETNQEILTRMQEGIAAQALSNRVNMTALLRAHEDFSSYVASSIIGYGDAEMLRDARLIAPISVGGRVDWYLRTALQAYRIGVTVTATLIEKTTDNRGIWQFGIGRDVLPGFYEVASIRPTTSGEFSGTYPIEEEIRSNDLTGDGFIPDVQTVEEGAYSRFQAAVVRFKDTDTATNSLTVNSSTKQYSVELRGQPLIKDLQEYLSSRDIRNYAGDLLVKAPVPCFVRLSFEIERPAGNTDEIDEDAIKVALADEVNAVSFTGRLPASSLSDVVHNFLKNDVAVSAIDMLGRIRRPDATTAWIRSSEVLVVPSEPDKMVTAKTVQFFLDPEDIGLSIVTVGEPQV